MKAVLTRLNPRYIRSLVYMLQASEYHIGDYLAWVHRTRDFANVEKRKHLVWTAKATILYVLLWLKTALLLVILFLSAYIQGSVIALGIGIAIILFLLPYILAILAFFFRYIIQYPSELFIIRSARGILRSHPAKKIAIAGSYGKTTFKEILKTVLSEGKKVAATPGNFNTLLGVSRFAKTLTGDEEILIIEMGEYYRGDIAKLCDLAHPDIGIITGVNEAHLSRFKDLTKTAETIFELDEALGDKPLYVNAENEPATVRASSDERFYNRNGVDGWRIDDAATGLEGTSFVMEKEGERIHAFSKLLGLHQIGPLAAAADIAYTLGLTTVEIERGLAKTLPFEHRMEPKRQLDGSILIDDSYNGNPDGVRAALAFLTGLDSKRKIYITPGLVEMGSKSEHVHTDIGELLAKTVDAVILVKNSVTPHIAQGLENAGFEGTLIWYEDMPSILKALPSITLPSDIILIQNDWPDNYA